MIDQKKPAMKPNPPDNKILKIRKAADILFVVCFLAILLVPFLKLDTDEIIDSTLENRRMTMWPGWHFDQATNEWYGHYVEDRVGYRNEAVQAYMDGVYLIFGEFSTKLHMYGKNKEIFPADEAYTKAYQHLATNEELIDSLAIYLDNANEYLQKKNITFVFMAGLDKKTVYPQYMPDFIHVDESKPSIMGMLSDKLDEKGVPYVIPINEFQQTAKEEQIYNHKYDSAHWNERGLIKGLSLLDDEILNRLPDDKKTAYRCLSSDDFDYSTSLQNIEFISLPITEQVPVITVKKSLSGQMSESGDLVDKLNHQNGSSFHHYLNPKAPSDLKVLIFMDSFLESHYSLFTYRFKDVCMVSRQNYEHMKEYVDEYEPDIVIYENAERAFVDDLYAYVNLRSVSFE